MYVYMYHARNTTQHDEALYIVHESWRDCRKTDGQTDGRTQGYWVPRMRSVISTTRRKIRLWLGALTGHRPIYTETARPLSAAACRLIQDRSAARRSVSTKSLTFRATGTTSFLRPIPHVWDVSCVLTETCQNYPNRQQNRIKSENSPETQHRRFGIHSYTKNLLGDSYKKLPQTDRASAFVVDRVKIWLTSSLIAV